MSQQALTWQLRSRVHRTLKSIRRRRLLLTFVVLCTCTCRLYFNIWWLCARLKEPHGFFGLHFLQLNLQRELFSTCSRVDNIYPYCNGEVIKKRFLVLLLILVSFGMQCFFLKNKTGKTRFLMQEYWSIYEKVQINLICLFLSDGHFWDSKELLWRIFRS